MKNIEEIIEYIGENDVKFVKLTFCDILGRQKNVSLNASHFREACDGGVIIDASAVGMGRGDLVLMPKPDTVAAMPWRPSSGSVITVMCGIFYPDGTPFEGDCMRILSDAETAFAETGVDAQFMTESEFYITRLSDNGEPTLTPVDYAGYLDAAPLDRCENLRREIVFTLESMGMKPLSSHHEHGHGQNAVIFRAASAYRSAINTVLFRGAVKNIAYSDGLYATFAPSPMENSIGSNFRIVAELSRGGAPADDKTAEAFACGVLARLPEIAVFTNPIRNSYRRLLHRDTPCRLTLGTAKSAVRVKPGGKVEITSADTACNPFIVLALIMRAGAEGLRGEAPDPDENAFLPVSLVDAVDAARGSEFAARSLPAPFLSAYLDKKDSQACDMSRDDVLRGGL